MFKNVGRQFFEWGKLICKTGIFLSFTAKNHKLAWGTLKKALALNRFFPPKLINLLCTG